MIWAEFWVLFQVRKSERPPHFFFALGDNEPSFFQLTCLFSAEHVNHPLLLANDILMCTNVCRKSLTHVTSCVYAARLGSGPRFKHRIRLLSIGSRPVICSDSGFIAYRSIKDTLIISRQITEGSFWICSKLIEEAFYFAQGLVPARIIGRPFSPSSSETVLCAPLSQGANFGIPFLQS